MSRLELFQGIVRSPEALTLALQQAASLNNKAELRFTSTELAIGATSTKHGSTVWTHLDLDYIFVNFTAPAGEGENGSFEVSVMLGPLCKALKSFSIVEDISIRITGRAGRPAIDILLQCERTLSEMNFRHRITALYSGLVSAPPVPPEPDVGLLDQYAEIPRRTQQQITQACDTLRSVANKVSIVIEPNQKLLTLSCSSEAVKIQMTWPIIKVDTDDPSSSHSQGQSQQSRSLSGHIPASLDATLSEEYGDSTSVVAVVSTAFWYEAVQNRPARMICGIGQDRVACIYCFLRPGDDERNFSVYYLSDLGV